MACSVHHLFAGHPLQAGVDMVVITLWLGHESVPIGAQPPRIRLGLSLKDKAL
jgi:hypothetical protein